MAECKFVDVTFASTTRHPTRQEKTCGEYMKEANIQNKMGHDKCDVYTAKETVEYRRENPSVSVARGIAERGENQRGIRGEVKTQTKNQNSPRRRREEPMEE